MQPFITQLSAVHTDLSEPFVYIALNSSLHIVRDLLSNRIDMCSYVRGFGVFQEKAGVWGVEEVQRVASLHLIPRDSMFSDSGTSSYRYSGFCFHWIHTMLVRVCNFLLFFRLWRS